MSSFTFKRRKAASSTPQRLPEGTKSSPALSTLLITSSGIPSLDDVLGGGIQLGTSLLVLNPDPHSAHSDLLQKYFIAQGLASIQQVHVFDPYARDLIDTCMWMPGANATPVPDDEGGIDADEGKVKIAWRYEGMQKFRTTVSSQASDQGEDYCRPFDLSCRIPSEAIEAFLTTEQLHVEDSIFENADVYGSIIRHVEDIAKISLDSSAGSKKEVVRVSIPAFSSPSWGDPTPERIVHFFLRLRAILRRNQRVCALVTLPAHLSSDTRDREGWIDNLAWVSDACVTISSASADPSTALLFPSHHGLLKIHKLPCVQTLIPASDRFSILRGLSVPTTSISTGGIGENNLAFKCTRKRFIIETFHLDIDGGVGERRTTPAPTSTVVQGGTAGKMGTQHGSHDHGPQSQVAIEMEAKSDVPEKSDAGFSHANLEGLHNPQEEQTVKKKPKKRVGFHLKRPDIFDF